MPRASRRPAVQSGKSNRAGCTQQYARCCRELYIGRIVWNKRKFLKKPGTNKRISIPRPEKDWVVIEEPSLRIIRQELWETVQETIKLRADQYSNGTPGLMARSSFNTHLFSGILKCSECGSNLTILLSRGKQRSGYYGCPGHLHRGICANNVYERCGVIEEKLLAGIRDRLLNPEALDYGLTELRHGLEAREEQEQATELFRKRTEVEKELDRIGDAIAQNGGSKFLLQTLNKKESELESVKKTIAKFSRSKLSVDAKWLRKRLAQEVMALPTLLNLEPERAKAHLLRHISEIRMTPREEDGKKFYVAEGEWVIVKTSPELSSTVTFVFLRALRGPAKLRVCHSN